MERHKVTCDMKAERLLDISGYRRREEQGMRMWRRRKAERAQAESRDAKILIF